MAKSDLDQDLVDLLTGLKDKLLAAEREVRRFDAEVERLKSCKTKRDEKIEEVGELRKQWDTQVKELPPKLRGLLENVWARELIAPKDEAKPTSNVKQWLRDTLAGGSMSKTELVKKFRESGLGKTIRFDFHADVVKVGDGDMVTRIE